MDNFGKYFKHLGLAAFFMLILVSGCKKDNDDVQPEEPDFSIQLVNKGGFGYILTDQDKQSIYFFAGDVSGDSKCNGGCAGVWPPVVGEAYNLELGSGLNRSDFGTVTRDDGQKQITFKGWPMYYFSPDGEGNLEGSGQTLGDGAGGVFHIAKPDYSVLLGRQVVTEGEEAVVYLVDDRGVSLYRNAADEENKSNCAGGCAGVWPPFKAEGLQIPSSLDIDDFASVDRDDDLGPQVSYLGNPLYFFSQDEQNRGSVLGQAGGPNQTFFVSEAEVD